MTSSVLTKEFCACGHAAAKPPDLKECRWPIASGPGSSVSASWAPCTPAPCAAPAEWSPGSSGPRRSPRGPAAERIGAEFAADSVEDLLAADDVDVVHVCTPNATHAPLVRAAIAAGKHVVCEKPLAVDAAEAAELVALAAEAGVTATVPFVYRFYPTVREARARVADGTAGPVRLLHGSYLQDWLAEDTDDNWRVDAAAGGASRAFADIGVHWCDLVEFVSGHRITRVAARTVVAAPERGGRT